MPEIQLNRSTLVRRFTTAMCGSPPSNFFAGSDVPHAHQRRLPRLHGLCHMDDALMAPVDTNHFVDINKVRQPDQIQTTGTGSGPQPRWLHDAGDYDLRVESQ